ncbi:M23 family peptidase [Pseudidiomarina sediminum]|uniref:M23 family peptidase n=1 Tax=Pseudidiomarina sediminum TaxID=431675 RepID=A0A432Z7M2_9GAMM|nr:M23 family metallopeptidase [Pseudidiomarina sediminum]RUO73912.1 M23 family peptidase [Pseudidiomarina sediminum]
MRKTMLALSLLLGCTRAVASEGIELIGAPTSGGLMIGKTEVGATVRLNDKTLTVSEAGYVVFGFARDAATSQQLTVTLPDGRVHQQQLTLADRSYKIDRIEGVPQRTVTPDPKQMERAAREAKAVRAARSQHSQRTDFLTPVIAPAKGRISGVYGSQRVYNGKPGNPHYGQDIAAPTGTPVAVVWPGEVVFADSDLFYSGGTVIVEHGLGLTTTYIHLNSVDVKVGERLEQGHRIGTVGATGRATGPHLDWRVNWGDVRLDPALVLEHFDSISFSD